jgi:hypothetical protein
MTRDVMDRLADARPAALDPPPDPSRRERDLVRALAASPGRRRRRIAGRPQLLATAALGTAAAIAFTYGGVVGSDEPRTARSGGPGASGSPSVVQPTPFTTARQVLLAAATSAERRPSAQGRYWKVSRLDTLGGVASRLYVAWYAKDGWQQSGLLLRDPKGAWRGDLYPVTKTSRPFEIADKSFTLAELEALPTDAKGLLKWARGLAALAISHGWKEDDLQTLTDAMLIQLLARLPAPPAVRAAAFRTLAARPGARSGGVVRDERGRLGNELRFGKDGKDRILVDPATSQLLSESTSNAKSSRRSAMIYVEVGWTDEKPHLPKTP